MILPTREEIDVYGSLDELAACRDFLGKDLHEAELLFREDCYCYYEDLMWMGIKAFRFYVIAAIRYLVSEHARDDCHGVQCFISAVTFRCDYDGTEVGLDVFPSIQTCLLHIIAHWEDYDIDETIYTELHTETVELLGRVEAALCGSFE